MKRLFCLLLLTAFITAGYSQGEIGFKKWSTYWQTKNVKLATTELDKEKMKVSLPPTGTGLCIYGTPMFNTSFVTFAIQNHSAVFNGSLLPGFQYNFMMAKYNANLNQPTYFSNYGGLGFFLVAGGQGNATVNGIHSALIGGACLSISSYANVGFGYDPINKLFTGTIGATFPLTVIEDKTATIFWAKQKTSIN